MGACKRSRPGLSGSKTSVLDEKTLVNPSEPGKLGGIFDQVVRKYDYAVLRLLLRITGSEEEAQDIYKAAFLQIHAKLGGFRFDCPLEVWIYRIVTPLCMDYLRKRAGGGTGAWRPALAALSPRERIVFELVHYDRLSLRTVGEVFHTTED